MANPGGNPSNLRPRPKIRKAEGPVGILIDRLLTEKDWTLYDLAKKAGLFYQNVQIYVRGKKNPTPETLAKLLAPFGLSATTKIEIHDMETNRLIEVLEK